MAPFELDIQLTHRAKTDRGSEHRIVDRIIDHLKLMFLAEKPPPRVFEQVALMAASLFLKNHIGLLLPEDMAKCHNDPDFLAEVSSRPSIKTRLFSTLATGCAGAIVAACPGIGVGLSCPWIPSPPRLRPSIFHDSLSDQGERAGRFPALLAPRPAQLKSKFL